MTRKEKTAKLLYDWLTTLIDSTITESWEEEYKMSPSFRAYVDAILALPLDVPSDEEIKDEIFANNPVLDGDPEWIYGFRQGQFSGAKMMRNEIIKRNRVINRDDMNDR